MPLDGNNRGPSPKNRKPGAPGACFTSLRQLIEVVPLKRSPEDSFMSHRV